MADISKNIKELRRARGMNQAQVAEKMGVTRQTVSGWERGISFPDLNTLKRLAQVFEITLDELIYPHRERKLPPAVCSPFTWKFIFGSMVGYWILLWLSDAVVVLPLLQRIYHKISNEEANFHLIRWSLILLVGYIGLCAGLLGDMIMELTQKEESGDGDSGDSESGKKEK